MTGVDPCAELLEAVIAALKADTGVAAAFAGGPVRIFDSAPPNARGDYIIVGPLHPLQVDGTDGFETEVTLDVWSLTEPPGKARVIAIGAAATAAVLAIGDLPSHRVTSAWPSFAQYLTDAGDQVTAHGIIKLEVVTQPSI